MPERFFYDRRTFYFFSFSAWWTLIAPTSFFVYLKIRNLGKISSTTGTFFGDAFAVFVVTTMIALFANYFGMRIYLFACDRSGRKDYIWWAMWSILFVFLGPFATVPYFFIAYRHHFSVRAPGIVKIAESA